MSQASASSQPPPSANPLIAAIVGLGIVSSSPATSWPRLPHSFAPSTSRPLMYEMSAPATRPALPCPVGRPLVHRVSAKLAEWSRNAVAFRDRTRSLLGAVDLDDRDASLAATSIS